MNLENYGIKARLDTTPNGAVLLELTTSEALVVKVNGQLLTSAEAPSDSTKQTFWTSDGRQTTAGTVDLRGEVPG